MSNNKLHETENIFSDEYPDIPKYKAFTSRNFRKISQIQDNFSERDMYEMEVVAKVLPFKANSYVVDELINWNNPRKDPIFHLTFPNRDMLLPHHFEAVEQLLKKDLDKIVFENEINKIRHELNPHPAGQSKLNIPSIDDQKLDGMQHKYDQTTLFFPAQGQTCHAYCTFCFRWPQFVRMDGLRFATSDIDNVINYIRANPQITDLLFTGGDPMVMNANRFAKYIDAVLDAKIPHLQNIRIGSKSLAYYPYMYLTENGQTVLNTFKKVTDSGLHLAFMAHFNHYVELSTPSVKEAIQRINDTGARIRTQSPVFKNINDSPEVWSRMWREQVKLGCVPYYMFIARDTGAQHYFSVTLERAWQIFREAYSEVSGLARTVRGPSMSCGPGKIQVLGVTEIQNEKIFILRFIQGRDKDWVQRPFFAKYNPDAVWIDDLQPAFGEKEFFFEEEYRNIFHATQEDYEKIEEN
ncbi:MAG: lysine 2,3-aminomutase [Candidatus Kapabacteria bacterium]|nr:lysine 2,3-aminomutase [Ignavibacteriota bacterium]MCW5884948.1 lysine 2,3-aminomutase [Candidatus Kapabacteria bacterium]